MNNNRYEQRYIAFIDILGFKDLVKKAEHNWRCFDDIKKALNVVLIETGTSHYVFPRTYLFSDSIIILADDEKNELLKLVNVARRLCFYMLVCRNMLTRGAIVKGSIYEDSKGIVFGPGLVKAVTMEKENARYPRILVDNDVCKDSSKVKYSENEKKTLRSFIRRDFDFLYHLDILKMGHFFDMPDDREWKYQIKGVIEQGLKKQKRARNNELYQKYGWFARYFNEYQRIWGDYLISPIQTE